MFLQQLLFYNVTFNIFEMLMFKMLIVKNCLMDFIIFLIKENKFK